jgi:hypothetical protein
MTLRCRTCGEAWTADSLHTEVRARLGGSYFADLAPESQHLGVRGTDPTYQQFYATVSAEFRALGCAALASFDARCQLADSTDDPDDLALIGTVYDLLGDDIDGAAAELEDLGLV